MASLPSYVAIRFPEYSEGFDPSVERTEMERGPAKQAIKNTHVFKQPKATFMFMSLADAIAFEDWYFNTIKRVGYFDFVHPLTGQPVQARFMGGDIGELVPLSPGFAQSQRTVTLEFMR